jgi:ADP-heptose:LPS heptosyltransferase
MKIMFVMLKTMGDVILGTTICRELKRDFPESEIHFYTNSPYGELLQNNPDIARVHESPDWNHDQIFLEMSRGEYDQIFAPYQVRAECNAWHQFEETRHQHLVDFYWKRMGQHRPIEERECYLFPNEETEKNILKFLSPLPVLAIHSTSGVASKDWPFFQELVVALGQDKFEIVQVGGRGDKPVVGAFDLRGKMGMLDLAAFLSKCAVFVGLDSGLSYMADAMKTPTIVIQGSTNPVTSGPISPRVIHLFAEKTGYDDCQVVRCHSNCRHEINCNTKITVDMVIEKIRSIQDVAGKTGQSEPDKTNG